MSKSMNLTMISSLVLVVGDDEEIASLLEKYLVRAGYRTTKASTGRTALAHVQRLQPDLILLDIGLPDIDGFDLLTKVRGNSTVPVIFVSAMDDGTDKLLSLKLGAEDYVTKPFNPQEVVARVGAVLRRTRGVTGREVIRHDEFEVPVRGGRPGERFGVSATSLGKQQLRDGFALTGWLAWLVTEVSPL